MPSTASTTYQDGIEAKLITAITTATTTGITVKVKQINGVTPTFPTAAHRLHILQRTALVNKHEIFDVAAGTTQSGQTVTLGTVTRALSLADGTNFSGSVGTAQTFAAGADVFLSWDAHDAALTPKTDIANTFTATNTFTSGLIMTATDKAFVPPTVTTTQRDAIASPTNGMIVYNSTTGVMNQYISGAWTTFATGTVSNAANGTGGKVDLATAAENAAGTATDATSGAANVIPTSIVKATSTGAVSGTVPMLNTSVMLDGTIGGIGAATPALGALLLGAGAGVAMSTIGPGSSGQVVKSNGTTLAMGAVPSKYVALGNTTNLATTTDRIASTSGSDTAFATVISVPANTLAATGDRIIVEAWGGIRDTATPTINIKVKYGTATVLDCGVQTGASGVSDRIWRCYVVFTASAVGASGKLTCWGAAYNSLPTTAQNDLALHQGPLPDTDTTITSVDTTATKNITVTANWSASNSANAISLNHIHAHAEVSTVQ